MSCRLLIRLVGLVLIFNVFWVCNGYSQKLNQVNMKLPYRRPAVKSQALGNIHVKRSAEEGGEHLNEYYYDDEFFPELEETHCSKGDFYHVRGLKCVPLVCPGGNQFRDKHTGDCILRSYGNSVGKAEDFRGRPSRFLSRMKSPTKFRLPFGLALKG